MTRTTDNRPVTSFKPANTPQRKVHPTRSSVKSDLAPRDSYQVDRPSYNKKKITKKIKKKKDLLSDSSESEDMDMGHVCYKHSHKKAKYIVMEVTEGTEKY